MVSVWYPALPTGTRTRQFPPAVAAYYDQNAGVPPGTADFAATLTHSRAGAVRLPGHWPVVLYSPGGGQSRFLGTTLVEDLASRGYVVVGMDHTPVGPVQFPDRFEVPRHGVDAGQVMRERVRDTSFVLDALRLRRVGMVGHSMGGSTTAEAMVTEPRIVAGVNLDGSMDPRYGQAAVTGVDRPFLPMGAGLSGDAPHNHLHSDRSLAVQRKYVSAFFDLHLRGRPTTIFDRPAYPEVEII